MMALGIGIGCVVGGVIAVTFMALFKHNKE